ncbi:MAG: RHS repeat-associated core domain-containing protein, partial [Thermoanaerobaculia bacterium]
VWEVEAEDSGWEARWTLRGLDGKVLRQYAFSRSGAGESIFEDGFESGDLCAWTDDSGSGPTCRSHGWFWERDHVYRDAQLLAEVTELAVLHRHVDHLGSLRQVTDELGVWQEDHAYLPFGEEVPASSRAPLQFTGHERDSHGAGSADDLDYMHARYCSPTMGRFLSVDPKTLRMPTKSPQRWNRYAYALGNPLKYVDETGRSPIKYWVKTVKGIYRLAKRSTAVRRASRSSHDVKVTGRGAAGEARRVAREASPGKKIVRHDPHHPGQTPHYQPKGGNKGHVHYDVESVIIAGTGLGAAAASQVEAATGSEVIGEAAGFVVDFFNPVSDIQEAASLLDEVGTDIVEAVYDVELDEEDEDAIADEEESPEPE